MMREKSILIFILCMLIGVAACTSSPEEAYRRLEKKELASGRRYDSLFNGLYLGMPHDTFREYCLQMHVQGKFREGGLKGGSWVECKLNTEMAYPAALNFYPEFNQGVISEMRAALYYDSDVSFKEHPFVRDSLLHDVLLLMGKWYGQGFMKIEGPDSLQKDLYVKINGNRRITVYPDIDPYIVNVWFVDLQTKRKKDES